MNIIEPTILALETSTYACSVSLLTSSKLQYNQYVVKQKMHNKIILNMVEKVLDDAKIKLMNLDAIAFGQGPGSFTGLRIAASVAQGLSYGIEKPVVPVSSLQALAQLGYEKTNKSHIVSMIDARMKEVYWGKYCVDNEGIMQPVLSEYISTYIQIHSKNFEQFIKIGIENYGLTHPRAQEVALIARHKFINGKIITARSAIPIYIRNKIV